MVKRKKISLSIMAAFYVLAGVNHFINPVFYKKIMPPGLPGHYPLIYISGISEIILGVLLIPQQTRKWAAWGVILLLVAVFPANVQMMLNYRDQQNPYLGLAILRLPLQLLLLGWAYGFTKSSYNKNGRLIS
ncbi:MAG: DoxX family protein [Chitinophagaceae bacterium]|nr:DoxX family protein [Chitinophagaceae bacterium]